MIDKLHNMANTILGLESVRYYDNFYRFTFINENEYSVEMTDSNGNIVNPIKQTRDNQVEFRLSTGVYYFRCYSTDEDTGARKKTYFEEIYVSSEMLDMSRTTKL